MVGLYRLLAIIASLAVVVLLLSSIPVVHLPKPIRPTEQIVYFKLACENQPGVVKTHYWRYGPGCQPVLIIYD